MKKIPKTEVEKEIKEFFKDVENKSEKDVKKIKKLAMSQSIPLKELRKKFCKKCYSSDLNVNGIKNKMKTVECKNCGNLMRWKIKN